MNSEVSVLNKYTDEQFQRIRDLARFHISCKDILEYYGWEFRGKRTESLDRNGKFNCLSVGELNGVYCYNDFSDNAYEGRDHGNSFDLLMLLHEDNIDEVINDIDYFLGIDTKKSLSVMREKDSEIDKLLADIKEKISYCHYNIFTPKYEPELNYLISRGYTENYIRDRLIGAGTDIFYGLEFRYIMFPFFAENDKEPVKYIKRYLEPGTYTDNQGNVIDIKKYWRCPNEDIPSLFEDTIYNLDQSISENNELVVVEGIVDSDTLNIYSEYPAIASSGKGVKRNYINDIVIPKIKDKHLTLIFDNDKDGKSFTYSYALNLIDHNIYDFDIAIIPKKDNLSILETYDLHFKDTNKEDHSYKDINEYYVKNKSLEGIFKTKVDGLYYLALGFIKEDKFEELEKFLKNISRFVSQTKLVKLITDLESDELLKKELAKELIRLIKAYPSDRFIADEVIEKIGKDNLFYIKELGFMRFNKVWSELSENYLSKLINESLGRFTSGSKLYSITKVISADVGKNKDFIKNINATEKLAFQNGTLDLKSGRFIDRHNYKDYMTTIQSYDYNPESTCPNWLKFLDEACEVRGDKEETENKKKILQEFAGYVLFPNNIFQTGLILTGEGSNGKSVFMNTISSVYEGDSEYSVYPSITNIDISDLSRDFHSIGLKDSLLNITSEAKASMRGSEEKFKALVAGDPITDSYKGKDFITFKPRAKTIISTNNEIVPADRSHAFWRRVLFVNFGNTFSTEPRNSKEKLADINLSEKLKEELSGIFNWCYEGYKRLKENGKFTKTKEHYRILGEHKETANNVLQFVNSSDFYDSIARKIVYGRKVFEERYLTDTKQFKEFYNNYKYFCSEEGLTPLSNRQFTIEIKRVLTDLGFIFELKRLHGFNGIKIFELPIEYMDKFNLKIVNQSRFIEELEQKLQDPNFRDENKDLVHDIEGTFML